MTNREETGQSDVMGAFFNATRAFAERFSQQSHDVLSGVTDGKAVGTYIERQFQELLLSERIIPTLGNSAKGIDLPALDCDIKVTSIRQPQSSSPFTSYKQKIEGLGYSLMVFVYDKRDEGHRAYLPFVAVRYIPKELTADFQTTKGITELIARGGNEDDIFAYLVERMIPVDEITLAAYARDLLLHPPRVGSLTISNAQQWRLQYKRVIDSPIEGIVNLYASESV